MIDLNQKAPKFDHAAYVEAVVEGELSSLASSSEGGRNDAMNRCAFALFRLVHGRALDEATARARIEATASKAGLGAGEIRDTLAHAYEDAQSRPRTGYETAGAAMSPEDREKARQVMEKAGRLATERAQEKAKAQDLAKLVAASVMAAAKPASENPYLTRKLVSMGYGLKSIHADEAGRVIGYTPATEEGRLQGELLAVPCFRDFEANPDAPDTLELIDGSGRKNALKGGGRGIWPTMPFPAPGTPSPLFLIGEGVATVLSAADAMKEQGAIGVAAFSNGRLAKAAQAIRGRYPDARIILLADIIKTTGKPDQLAVKAAKDVSGSLAVPDFGPGWTADMGTDFNDLANADGFGPDAVRKCIEAAEAFQEEAAACVWDSPADIAAMLATEPEPMKCLVRDNRTDPPAPIIPLARGGVLSALGGTGKTTLLKVLARGCITGKLPFEEWAIERTGKVLLVLTEDTIQEFHEDLHCLCRGLSQQERDLIKRDLVVYPLAGEDTRLLLKSPRGVMEKSAQFHSLVSRVKSLGDVVLVGLDPALGVTEGDENNNPDQRALGRAVDDLAVETGATCILLSHSGKAIAGTKELGSHSSRGGGAITDAVRFEFVMRGMTAEEAKTYGVEALEDRFSHVQIALTKGNRVPPSGKVPVWLRFDRGGFVSANLEEPEKKAQAGGGGKLPKGAALAFEALKEAAMEYGQTDCNGRLQYVAMDDFRAAHKERYTQRNPANTDRAERMAFQDGTSKLVELGWIESDGLTVTFSGPGKEVHVETVSAAIAERRGGSFRKFSEETTSPVGSCAAEETGSAPPYRGPSASENFRGGFEEKEEIRLDQSENPSSPGTFNQTGPGGRVEGEI